MAKRLGEMLVEKKIVTEEQLQKALEEQKESGEFLGQVLIKMGFIGEIVLLNALSQQMDIPYMSLKEIKIDDLVIKGVPAKFAWHYKVMPIKLNGNILTIAVSNPFDMWPLDDIESNLGFRVERVLSTQSDIMEAIKKYYGAGA